MGRTFHHLSLDERVTIQAQLTMQVGVASIAAELNRPRSTIWREMRRNGWSSDKRKGTIAGGYRCVAAERRARVQRRKPRRKRKLADARLWALVVEHLQRGLSPAQIARTLARMPEPVRLSYETIYTALYAMPRGQLRASILNALRRRHKARRRGRGKNGRGKSIPDMTLIDHRPEEVAARLVPGHWEADLIIGKGNLSQVGVLVERRTLFVALVRLPDGKAATVAECFGTIFQRFDSQMRLSMTFDQGSEMSQHKSLTARLGLAVYFAHPHSPWERGICENTNGLLRQYLPKGQDLSVYSQQELDEIAWRLNSRPRKTLNWLAPAELFLPEGAFNFPQYWSEIVKTPSALTLEAIEKMESK